MYQHNRVIIDLGDALEMTSGMSLYLVCVCVYVCVCCQGGQQHLAQPGGSYPHLLSCLRRNRVGHSPPSLWSQIKPFLSVLILCVTWCVFLLRICPEFCLVGYLQAAYTVLEVHTAWKWRFADTTPSSACSILLYHILFQIKVPKRDAKIYQQLNIKQ